MSSDEEVPLHELRIWVCRNCVLRVAGECHVPGCFYCHHDVADVPTFLAAYVTAGATPEASGSDHYAVIHVQKGPSHSWPVVRRVARGWQSGAHHYPDADVLSVTPLVLTPAGRVSTLGGPYRHAAAPVQPELTA